ncbi:MAG: hypothetical protein B6U87_03005, partial [Candidatus Aenigmarchaeota archaeon ex4484_52]
MSCTFVQAEEEKIAISTCQELQDINKNLAGDYYMANDIDCSDTINWNKGKGFEPIQFFAGLLDGEGHKITD